MKNLVIRKQKVRQGIFEKNYIESENENYTHEKTEEETNGNKTMKGK